jgi:hypothetical protein
MPKRGSVQLLLLSLRPRATLGWGIGAAMIIVLLAGVVPLREVPFLGKSGLAQALRQSVWKQALSGQSPVHWPWEDLSANMSLAPSASVPRLGLSAALLKYTDDAPEPVSSESSVADQGTSDVETTALGDVVISDVTIGDSITFTAADGTTCVYRITGRDVVDPHLAAGEAEQVDGTRSLFNCGPLDRLIMQATQGARSKLPMPSQRIGDQQKL